MNVRIVFSLVALALVACSPDSPRSGGKPSPSPAPGRLEVRTDWNVETLGIIFSQARESGWLLEHSNKRDDSYFLKLFRHRFVGFAGHPAVLMLDSLAEAKILSITSLYLALHFSPLPDFQLIHEPGEGAFAHTGMDRKAFGELLEKWAVEVRKFYRDAQLEAFFRENEALYAQIREEVESSSPAESFLDSLSAFYGGGGQVRLVIVPSPTMFSQWGFGHQLVEDGDTVYYQFLSHSRECPYSRWEDIDPEAGLGFNDADYIQEFAVHEFGHSFVRFLDKPENTTLVASISRLNTGEIREAMRRQWQGQGWHNVFEEHLVRAIEVLTFESMGKTEYARKKRDLEVEESGFEYLDAFLVLLREYKSQRDRYPRFEQYLPVLVEKLPGLVEGDPR